VKSLAVCEGIQPFSTCNYLPSDFFEPFHRLYGKTFPTTQDAINKLHALDRACAEEDARNGAAREGYNTLSFDDFWELLTEDRKFPGGKWNLRDYVAALNKSVTYSGPIQMKDSSFKQLARLFWSDGRFKVSPSRNGAFAMALDDDRARLVDDGDMPIYLFNPEGEMPRYWYLDKKA
jgi:hypothetical protein